MTTIKQYITNNKQLIIIFIFMGVFLLYHNKVYCDPSLFQKWYSNMENYFLTLTWEKAISDPIELSKSVGWVSIGAIGSLYAFEGIWNARLLGSKALYKFTPLGHLDDGSGYVKSWFGFRNTAGPLKNIIDSVPYEEILPLYWARNYVFPRIFIQPKPTDIISSKVNPDTNLNITNNTLDISPSVPEVSVPEVTPISNVEPQIVERIREVNTYFEVPVYINKYVPVIEYRDRENLLDLGRKIERLSYVTNESNLLKIGYSNGYEQIKNELNHIVDSTLKEPSLLRNISVDKDEERQIIYEFKNGFISRISYDDFNYPLIKDILLTTRNYNKINHVEWVMYGITFDILPYIEIKYAQRSFFSGGGSDIVYDECLLGGIESKNPMPLIREGISFFLTNHQGLSTNQDEQTQLLHDLKQQLQSKLRNTEVQDKGMQTSTFDLNETVFDRINTFLEAPDDTYFSKVTREGRYLPFNNMASNNTKSNKQEEIIKQSEDFSVQTDPIENTETIDLSPTVSTIIQNPALMFAAALTTVVVNDFHTVQMAAETLLGFTQIPEYNDAFVAATHSSSSQLKETCNVSNEIADRMVDVLDYAYDIKYPETNLDLCSTSSDSGETTSKALTWSKYVLFGVSTVFIIGTVYLYWSSVKTGLPVNETVQDLSSSTANWGKEYMDKINKL